MNKGTVAFLAVNASYAHTNLASWYLRAVAEGAGWVWHEVEAVKTEPLSRLLARMAKIKPDVLAASFYVFNVDFLGAFLPRFKIIAPQCVVIGGGPEFLGDNASFLKLHPEIDLVVRGEGEKAFGAWLEVWRTPSRWKEIKGVCFLSEGEYVDNGRTDFVSNLDSIPTPFRRMRQFSKPFLLMETSRGCSGACAFCTSAGERVRCFSEERFRSDLELIAKAGIKEVRLADRTFNEHPDRCVQFIRIMRDEFNPIRFHLEIDPGRLTDEVLEELAVSGAGRFHLEVGLQTIREEVLRCLGRRGGITKIMMVLKNLCAMRNISVHVDLMAGLPGASLADLYEGLRQVAALGPDEIQVELLKILPGTRLAGETAKLGIIASPLPPYEVLRTDKMSHEDLTAAERLSRVVDWVYNVSELQSFCKAALAIDQAFLEKLAVYAREEADAAQTPSLENRFRLIAAYCCLHLPVLVPKLGYEWLKWGLSPQKGICPAVPWKKTLPESAVLVEGDCTIESKRIYMAELDKTYFFVYAGSSGRRPSAIYACNA